jgi:hypothetical protein
MLHFNPNPNPNFKPNSFTPIKLFQIKYRICVDYKQVLSLLQIERPTLAYQLSKKKALLVAYENLY